MSDPVVAFVQARLDEEAEAASRAAFCWGGNWTAVSNGDDWADLRAEGSPRVAGSEDIDVLAHAARWDPARVLAEVAAKRALIEIGWGIAYEMDGEWGDGCDLGQIKAGECRDRFGQNPVALPLAQVWAEHPDFNPARKTP